MASSDRCGHAGLAGQARRRRTKQREGERAKRRPVGGLRHGGEAFTNRGENVAGKRLGSPSTTLQGIRNSKEIRPEIRL